MNTSDINLASGGVRAPSDRIYKILRIVAFLTLFIVASSSILAFIATRQISIPSIKKDQNTTLYSLSFLRKKEAKVLIINDRLKNIGGVLKERKNYLNTVTAILKETTGVSATTLSVDKDTIELTVSSSSLLSINNFLNNLISSTTKRTIKIRDLSIESLTLNRQGGNYSLSVKAKLL